MANPAGKTRPKDNPYETWATPMGNMHVLKKYVQPSTEAKDPYARWLVFCDNEYAETGDNYAAEVKRYGRLIYRDPTLTEF